jgi:hypothetical protein
MLLEQTKVYRHLCVPRDSAGPAFRPAIWLRFVATRRRELPWGASDASVMISCCAMW